MSHSFQLPDGPIGDIDSEIGDYVHFLNDYGEGFPSGDFTSEEEGDLLAETGGPVGAIGRITAKLATRGNLKTNTKVALARDPRKRRLVAAAAQAKAAARTMWATFEHVKGAKFINSSLGVGSRLRAFEVDALKTHAASFPLAQPVVVPVTISGGSGTIQVDKVLEDIYGLANGTQVRYIGAKVTFAVSPFNRTPGGEISITRGVASGVTQRANIQLSKHDISSFTFINGGLISGKARFFAPLIAANTTATGTYPITVTGVPADYTVSVRLLIPGDQEAERLLTLL